MVFTLVLRFKSLVELKSSASTVNEAVRYEQLIDPAEKSPDAFLATKVSPVFKVVPATETETEDDPLYELPAVKYEPKEREFKLFPKVIPEIVDAANFDTAIPAEALISSFKIVPFKILPEVTTPTLAVLIRVPVSAGSVSVPDADVDARKLVNPDDPLKLAPALPTVGVVRVLLVRV
jgi:hypothetical protein